MRKPLRSLAKSRKGYIGDVLTWSVILCVLVVIVFFIYLFLSEASDNNTDSNTQAFNDSLSGSTAKWARGWDVAIVAGLGFMLLATLTTAWMIGTNPAFFWISLIVLILFLLAIVVFHNLANAFIDDSSFVLVAENMKGTFFILRNLLWITIGGAGLLLIVLFAKNRSEGL